MSIQTNLHRYRKDIDELVERGRILGVAMLYELYPESYDNSYDENYIKNLPDFKMSYQSWYSESLVLIKQLLPDRFDDFVSHYKKPKARKKLDCENYRIEDFLQGIESRMGDLNGKAAIPHFRQQMGILKAVLVRFESSLFDIKQLVQADLFDSEIESGRELLAKGHVRASGAVAGVVLEKHLTQVCLNHNISSKKKNSSISDFNDILKTNAVIDIPTWRQIQRLTDIRNYCDHSKEREPTVDEVQELLDGVDKITKTLF